MRGNRIAARLKGPIILSAIGMAVLLGASFKPAESTENLPAATRPPAEVKQTSTQEGAESGATLVDSAVTAAAERVGL